LDTQFTRTFRLQTYKEHRETVLRDRERSRLPDTQDDAVAYQQAKQVFEEENRHAEELKIKIHRLEIELRRVEYRIYQANQVTESYGRTRMRNLGTTDSITSSSTKTEPKRQFIRACPAPDCKGFLSTAWKCGLCMKWTCSDCHELIGPTKETEHTCDPDKLASARLIEEESQPCPKCGARICKIDGCNQMWCTVCNTGFDWRTGTIAKGPIHNPHYFQWLQRQGASVAVGGAGADGAPMNFLINCDQELDRQVSNVLYRQHNRFGYNTRNRDPADPRYHELRFLGEAWRMTREYADPEYGPQATLRETAEQYRRLRVRYLANEIDEDTWRTSLQRIEKDELHAEAIQQVRDLYANAARDIIRGVVAEGADISAIVHQIQELIGYVNESFGNIAKRFGRKAHVLKTN
jgi:hypothetical protein